MCRLLEGNLLEAFHNMFFYLNFDANYKVLERLGQGSHSVVLKCESRSDRNFYAVKVSSLNIIMNMRF